jgi:hypothetical protein
MFLCASDCICVQLMMCMFLCASDCICVQLIVCMCVFVCVSVCMFVCAVDCVFVCMCAMGDCLHPACAQSTPYQPLCFTPFANKLKW